MPVILFCVRLAIWTLLRRLRRSGRNTRLAVIAGVNTSSLRLAEQLNETKELGIKLIGFFDDSYPRGRQDIPILGTLLDLPQYMRNHQIDVVYLTDVNKPLKTVTTLIEALEDTTACVYFIPNVLISNLIHGRSYELNGIPLIAIWEIPFSDLQYFLKRSIDIGVALLAIIILSPIMLVVAIAIKLSSPGPVLFKQRRYGLNGQEIIVYKFRSMTVMQDGHVIPQASQFDKRVTSVGKILRKTSLDELPQFINVLQGRMSLVGPRPHAVAHNELYRKQIDGYMLRHKVKPGITGLAQVNGCRGETDTLEKMQQRIDYDLQYLKNWSLSLDIRIILQTIFVVFRGQNAY